MKRVWGNGLTGLMLLVGVAAASGGTPACVHDDSTIFVSDVLAPQFVTAGMACTFTADPTQPTLGQGTLDTALSPEYTAEFLVGNQIVPAGNPNQPQTETSFVTIKGAVVRIVDSGGNQLNHLHSQRGRHDPALLGDHSGLRVARGHDHRQRHGGGPREHDRRDEPQREPSGRLVRQVLREHPGRRLRRVQRVRLPRQCLPTAASSASPPPRTICWRAWSPSRTARSPELRRPARRPPCRVFPGKTSRSIARRACGTRPATLRRRARRSSLRTRGAVADPALRHGSAADAAACAGVAAVLALGAHRAPPIPRPARA